MLELRPEKSVRPTTGPSPLGNVRTVAIPPGNGRSSAPLVAAAPILRPQPRQSRLRLKNLQALTDYS